MVPEEGKKGLIHPRLTGIEATDSPLTEASWGAVLICSPLSSAMGAPLLQLPLGLSCCLPVSMFFFFFPSQSRATSGPCSMIYHLSPSIPLWQTFPQTQTVCSAHCQDNTHILAKGTSDTGSCGQTPWCRWEGIRRDSRARLGAGGAACCRLLS